MSTPRSRVVLLALVAVFLVAASPFPQTVTIPPDVYVPFVAALTGLIAFGVTQGIKALSEFLARYPWLKWIEVKGWGSVITAFVVNGVLFYLEGYALPAIPDQYGPIVVWVVTLLTLLFQVFISSGLHSIMKHFGPVKEEG